MKLGGSLGRVADALEYLAAVVESSSQAPDADLELLVDTYLRTRRTVSREYRAIAEAFLGHGEGLLQKIKRTVADEMLSRYGGRIPPAYLEVSGYSGVQPVLFAYLARHVGEPVSASKLRLLTGDQVHTERRVRELRELGLDVTWSKTSGEDNYVLRSLELDLATSARYQLIKNIKKDKKLNASARTTLLKAADFDAQL